VYGMVSSASVRAPYRYDHAKYIVVDRKAVMVVSENFKYSGFAPKETTGNRGWGVVITDPAAAAYFAAVFETDLEGPSIRPFNATNGTAERLPTGTHATEFSPRVFTGATVRPVLAPDTSGQILTLINAANQSIDIEEAYISNETRYGLNPYLAAAINASRRGVHVRVLLDSYYYNVEGTNDNDEQAALINRIATAEHLPLEARCAELAENQIAKIHNKGMIVDGKEVLVSSINWNSNSPNFNREAGVIIDHAGVAGYFRSVFEDTSGPCLKTTGTQPSDRRGYRRTPQKSPLLRWLLRRCCFTGTATGDTDTPAGERIRETRQNQRRGSEIHKSSEFFLGTLADIAEVDVALAGDYGKRPPVDDHVQFAGDLDFARAPLLAHVLGDGGPGEAHTFCCIALAQPLLLHQTGDHLGPHRRQEVPDHRVAVHQGAAVFCHTQTGWGFVVSADRFW